jgi:hypothetical protein
MKKKKILRPNTLPKATVNVLCPEIGRDKPILFSFKHLNDKSPFNFSDRVKKRKWYCDFLDRLKIFSDKKITDLLHSHNSKTFRFHAVKLGKDNNISKKTFGILDQRTKEINSELDENAYQFSISKSNGRVIGYIIENVFFVVWLDKDHECYSGCNK